MTAPCIVSAYPTTTAVSVAASSLALGATTTTLALVTATNGPQDGTPTGVVMFTARVNGSLVFTTTSALKGDTTMYTRMTRV